MLAKERRVDRGKGGVAESLLLLLLLSDGLSK